MQKMHWLVSLFCFMTIVVALLGLAKATKTYESVDITDGHAMGIIGAILDNSSRIGKEETVAIKMALEDFYLFSNQSFVLHIRDSQGNPLQAAFAVRDLIDKQQVQAIIGPQTWEETSLVAEICSQKSTPVVSLADATPNWATEKWNYLVRISASQFKQMKAVAAVIQSWEWYQVSIIYEDRDSASTRALAHLSKFLKEVNAKISNYLALPPTVSSSLLSQELEKLREGESRVFVVHLSASLALQLFDTAKKMNMIDKDYVWITTEPFTSLVHSLNASTISSMQGIIGIKSYFPEIGKPHENFFLRFSQKFSSEHPEEYNHQPGIFAVQAYDAAWTLALAIRETNKKGGKVLLDNILVSNFTGLSGNIRFHDHKLPHANIFQIINEVGKSYREIGFWSDGLGFSKTIGQNATYSSSMKELGKVFWPGGPLHTPRGRKLPSNAKPLRIGVPISSMKQFVNITREQSKNTTVFGGFTVDLFKATVELLPYHLPYEFLPFNLFNGTYDDLVEQIHLKNYDAVVGDVSILAKRSEHAAFTEPFTHPGVLMVVPLQSKSGNKAWLFLKPFTKTMWILIGAMIVYNGFVLWLIERNYTPELNGSLLNQTGIVLWFSFSTFISLHGDKLHSNLSRMTMVIWLFVALIITQTYTANLASMLTVEQLQPTVNDVDQLRNSHATVGHFNGSFLKTYLREVLDFHPENIKAFNSMEDFASALRKNEIAAAFFSFANAKIFLAKYCKEFAQAGPTYRVGGFAFAFPKGSPLLHGVNKALLEVSENGQLRDMENRMLGSEECADSTESGGKTATSLQPNSFWALFIFTGGTSTIALLVYIFSMNDLIYRQKAVWKLMVTMVKKWGSWRRLFTRRVMNVAESPTNSTTVHGMKREK